MLEMNYTEQQLTAAVVSDGLRPALAGPELRVPNDLLSLIKRCWDGSPHHRPSFHDIIVELYSILDKMKRTGEEDVPSEKFFSPQIYNSDVAEAGNFQGYQETVNWSRQGAQFSMKSSPVANNSSTRVWPETAAAPSDYQPTLSCGSFATCGRRESMEDTHFLLPHFCNEKGVHVFGIFDGHRGNY